MILFKPQRWENSYFKTSLKAAWFSLLERLGTSCTVSPRCGMTSRLRVTCWVYLDSGTEATLLNWVPACARGHLSRAIAGGWGWFLPAKKKRCFAVTIRGNQTWPCCSDRMPRSLGWVSLPYLFLASSILGCPRPSDILWGQNWCCLRLIRYVRYF